ncbi:MAG: ParB/RepB/Spo0J family partition protein, partial [Pirellulaceae bacterium]
GQMTPIEITADGTIICGHTRVAAMRMLGRTKITAIIRHDLGDPDSPPAKARMIQDNMQRHQLSQIDRAVCCRHLVDLYEDTDELPGSGDRRDRLADMLGIRCGKTLERLLKMADAPMAVREAYKRGQLTQQAVLQVVGMSSRIQAEIVAGIELGRKPKDVVATYLSKSPKLPQGKTLVKRLTKSCTTLIDQMQTLLAKDELWIGETSLAEMQEIRGRIGKLIRAVQEQS